ncbi:putative ser-Thr-rich glycosyl-phosphatidyl-inositol-anchored membrane family protein [Lyophyllum shimeji]|uniref:Ser-Thr-rich glycosyl-phosphatidyl-inositol-anchored membrane family protein n=1 Tax=Lyophyllum shimeji TaxID=47721 RepID=A0A9P3PSG9_LYOSH|nr:putative ser-Thr-rich glycosyl-phosphatidyl-inositol-anchored membrane family protein [Lyophyllum shimeji]
MSTRFPWLFVIVAIASLLRLNVVLGSVFPTQPTADTKFSSGQIALVTWRDDSHAPRLEGTGNMKIDLHGKNAEYIATLARHVPPTACSHPIFIPPGLQSASYYTIRFITKDPPLTIYSSDFTILTDSYLFPARPAIVNTTMSMTSASASTSLSAAPTVYTNPMGAHPGAGPGLRNSASSAPKKNSGTKVLGTMRFRLLAILWPALVGISMAL